MAFRQFSYPAFLQRVYEPAPWGRCRNTDRWAFGRRLLDPVHPDRVVLRSVRASLARPDAEHPCLRCRLRCTTLLSVPWDEEPREGEDRVRVPVTIPWPEDLAPPRTVHVPRGGVAKHRRFNVSMPYPPPNDRVSRKAIFALALTLSLLEEGTADLGGGEG